MKKICFYLIFVACNLFYLSSNGQSSKKDVEDAIDLWCSKEFNDCFSGRTYESITVNDYSVSDDQTVITATGRVTYKNLLDIQSTTNFNCTITLRSTGRGVVKFLKQDSADSSSWDSCEKSYDP